MRHRLHPDTRRMFTVLSAAMVGGMVGLGLLFWALERSSLLALQASTNGAAKQAPLWVSIMMFAGLILVNFALFFGLVQWSRYIRKHPRTYQLPVWSLFSIVAVAGALIITAMARHSAFVHSRDVVSVDVSSGYIAFQVVLGALVLGALVLLGVRWAPGYRPYVPPRD